MTHIRISRLIIALAALLISAAPAAHARTFVDFGPAQKFIELDAHVMGGGSLITENYMGCYKEISEMNTSSGLSGGVGVAAVFGLRDWIGLGTELNLMTLNYRTDIAVSNDDATNVSNIFLRNSQQVANIPVFIQFRFNVADNVRWTVDAGVYYNYGLHGRQKQAIYSSQVNSLGQLVNNRYTATANYYNSRETFINTYHRSDIGVHLATGLQLGRRVTIAGRLDMGLKNVAHIVGNTAIITPNIHNFGFSVGLGYRF